MSNSQATLLLMKQLKGAQWPVRSPTRCGPPLRRLRAPPPPPVAAARGARRSKPPDPALPGRADLNKNPVEGFSAGLMDESDPFKWEIMIMGPGDTP